MIKEGYAVGDSVFDIKYQKIVKIIGVWDNERVQIFTTWWLPPEQNTEAVYRERIFPLTMSQQVMLRLTGKI
jgi:hypothetical protein